MPPLALSALGDDTLEVRPALDVARIPTFFQLQALQASLLDVIVCGIPTVERAVINKKPGGGFNLIVEGTNLAVRMCVHVAVWERRGGV